MRLLIVAAAIVLTTVAGFAEAPKEILPADTLTIQPGEARIFEFPRDISRVEIPVEGVVQVVPDSSRTLTIRGIKSGSVIMSAYAPDGGLVYRANVLVGGRLVRIYGTEPRSAARGSQGRDFVGYNCTTVFCGRADPDKVEDPAGASVTISETRQTRDGTVTTTTQQPR